MASRSAAALAEEEEADSEGTPAEESKADWDFETNDVSDADMVEPRSAASSPARLVPDDKYRDQLRGAWKFLSESIGSVMKMDELCQRQGSAPLRDLLEHPRATQLQEIESAQDALEILTILCQQEGIVIQRPALPAGLPVPEAAPAVPAPPARQHVPAPARRPVRATEEASAARPARPPPPVRSAVARKREDIVSSAFRGNDRVCNRGTLGSNAQRARKSYADRARDHFEEELENGGFIPPEAQSVGDCTALVLTAFHEVMQPILEKRCTVNPKTNQHLRSITNRGRFVSDNIKNTTTIFHRVVGNSAEAGNWFVLHHVGGVIRELLIEAAKEKHGRWQWRGFYLEDWEVSWLTLIILRAFIAGASWDDEGAWNDFSSDSRGLDL